MSEQEWLYQIVNWSGSQEEYISRLQQRSNAPGDSESLNEWEDQFQQIRKTAEQEMDAWGRGGTPTPYSAHFLLQKVTHLYHGFYWFLQRFQSSPQRQTRTAEYPGYLNKGNQGPEISGDHNGNLNISVGDESSGTEMKREEMTERMASEDWYPKKGGKSQNGSHPVPIGEHQLPPLPYPYDALEPYIDEKTMRLHHDEHHRSYVEGLNKAEKEMQKARKNDDYSLIKHWEREAAFNGAGHYLHTIFWNVMTPNGREKATGPIAEEIDQTFGSFQKLQQQFSEAAKNVEGGGWSMLIWSPRSHRVEILQAEKHQNLSQQDMIPLLVLDVWEHAYYLKYNNNREDYVKAWWHVVNWDTVNERYMQAKRVQWHPY